MPIWKKNLYILVVGQAAFRASVTIIIPFLPFYIMELGVTEVTAIAVWTGVISSINFLTQAISSPFWGSVADRFGRKPMIIRATLASGFFTVFMALSVNIYQLFIFRTLMGLMSGYHASAVTLIASETPEKNLGYALSLLQIGQMVGTLFGPVIGGIISYFMGYQMGIMVAGLIKILIAIPVLIVVKENFSKNDKAGLGFASILNPLKNGFKILAFSKELKVIMILIIISGLAIRSIEPIMGLFVSQVYSGDYLDLMISSAYSITALSIILFSPIWGTYGDKRGFYKVLLVSFVLSAIITIPHIFVNSLLVLLLLRFLWGGSIAGILPLLKASVSRFSPPEHKGAIYGLLASCTAFGNFLGALGGGTIVGLGGFETLFIIMAILFILSAITNYYLKLRCD